MLDELLTELVTAQPRLGGVRLLAIDGPSGSGKSVLADRIVDELTRIGVRTALVRTDHFATWDDPVAWWPRLVDQVLTPLSRGRAAHYRCLDWTDGWPRQGRWITVEPPEVLVLEGVSSGRRSAGPLRSLLVWVELADQRLRLERAVARDGEACREPLRQWQLFEQGWFAVDETRARAEQVVSMTERG